MSENRILHSAVWMLKSLKWNTNQVQITKTSIWFFRLRPTSKRRRCAVQKYQLFWKNSNDQLFFPDLTNASVQYRQKCCSDIKRSIWRERFLTKTEFSSKFVGILLVVIVAVVCVDVVTFTIDVLLLKPNANLVFFESINYCFDTVDKKPSTLFLDTWTLARRAFTT